MPEMKTLTINDITYEVVDDGAVRYTEQNLTPEQQAQARANIGAAASIVTIATEHGISTDASDNSPALQALIDRLSDAGGGIIYFPIGTYKFQRQAVNIYNPAIVMKSNVSIVGENIEKTVFKQVTEMAYPMFWHFGTADNPITGCTFHNFTVDAYATGNVNEVMGKAFFFQFVRDCVFRDLILKGTIATAMGIDRIDRTVIDNVSCIDCGRTYTGVEAGTSGIGIGTGGWWENENFIITNCICDGCGQYGIFVEDQNFLGGRIAEPSKGSIISNCIVKNGLNNGIGVRGAANISIIGCEVYENAKNGIFVEGPCKNVKIMSCGSANNAENGIYLQPAETSSTVTVKGCTFTENAQSGIVVNSEYGKLCISENHTDGNNVGLEIGKINLKDCVLYHNTLMDDANVEATFTGVTAYNDFSNASTPRTIVADSCVVNPGGNVQLNYSVFPANSDKRVSFTSSNQSVATVDSAGNVTGVSLGDCEITIRSAVDSTVFATIVCSVVNISVSVANEAFIPGITINKQGTENSNTAGAATDYIATGSGEWLVYIHGFDYTTGGRIALYDANKVFLKEYTLVGGQIMDNHAVIGHEDMAYVRFGTNSFNNENALELRKCTIIADNAKAALVLGTKLEPDGTTTALDAASATDFIDISQAKGAAYYLLLSQGYTAGMSRFAQYDADKKPISGSIITASEKFTEVSVKDTAKYIRVSFIGNVSSTVPFAFVSTLAAL